MAGYAHYELNRNSSLLNKDYWLLDDKGPLRILPELYAREGRLAVLDAGCGTGNQLWDLIDYNAAKNKVNWDNIAADAVSDYDFSKYADRWRVRAGIMTGDVNYVVGDLNDPSLLPESAYDLIYSHEVMLHLERPQQVIRNLWHALRPAGVLYFNAPGEQLEQIHEATTDIAAAGGMALSGEVEKPPLERFRQEQGQVPVSTRYAFKVTKPE